MLLDVQEACLRLLELGQAQAAVGGQSATGSGAASGVAGQADTFALITILGTFRAKLAGDDNKTANPPC